MYAHTLRMATLSGGRRAAARAFKAARGKKGLTQDATARAAGVDRMVINRFEGGKTWPDALTQAKLEPIVAMPAGTLEDIVARYETDADLIDRETELTEQLTSLTRGQAEIVLAHRQVEREMRRRRVALLRQALHEGRTDDAVALVDELDELLDNDEI